MEIRNKVSEAVIRRLPGYYRYLEQLEQSGLTRISSQQLGARMGLTASQIRQDINCFGALGQQGYGYNIGELRAHIAEILGIGRSNNVIILGAGNIGQAVAQYPGFANLGFCVKGIFDVSEALVGKNIGGVQVLHSRELDRYLEENVIHIGVLCVPADKAQAAADELVCGGVKGIWNFAPVDIAVREGISVQNVQLTDSLLVLSYHMLNDSI